jgi:hypothetical protein
MENLSNIYTQIENLLLPLNNLERTLIKQYLLSVHTNTPQIKTKIEKAVTKNIYNKYSSKLINIADILKKKINLAQEDEKKMILDELLKTKFVANPTIQYFCENDLPYVNSNDFDQFHSKMKYYYADRNDHPLAGVLYAQNSNELSPNIVRVNPFNSNFSNRNYIESNMGFEFKGREIDFLNLKRERDSSNYSELNRLHNEYVPNIINHNEIIPNNPQNIIINQNELLKQIEENAKTVSDVSEIGNIREELIIPSIMWTFKCTPCGCSYPVVPEIIRTMNSRYCTTCKNVICCYLCAERVAGMNDDMFGSISRMDDHCILCRSNISLITLFEYEGDLKHIRNLKRLKWKNTTIPIHPIPNNIEPNPQNNIQPVPQNNIQPVPQNILLNRLRSHRNRSHSSDVSSFSLLSNNDLIGDNESYSKNKRNIKAIDLIVNNVNSVTFYNNINLTENYLTNYFKRRSTTNEFLNLILASNIVLKKVAYILFENLSIRETMTHNDRFFCEDFSLISYLNNPRNRVNNPWHFTLDVYNHFFQITLSPVTKLNLNLCTCINIDCEHVLKKCLCTNQYEKCDHVPEARIENVIIATVENSIFRKFINPRHIYCSIFYFRLYNNLGNDNKIVRMLQCDYCYFYIPVWSLSYFIFSCIGCERIACKKCRLDDCCGNSKKLLPNSRMIKCVYNIRFSSLSKKGLALEYIS